MATKTKFELKNGMATREAFGKTLVKLGHENPNVVVCDADLSKSTYTTYFAQEFPGRFFSCGIAEANMVAVGAGLAYAGKIPFVSSFSCFVVNKGFEQLRVGVAYPNANLKVVGTHSGISIGEDGPSQMSIEETALACSLPVITTRANGAHELLSPPREGYVLDDPHDHDLFAWSMAQLLDPQRRHACALAARKTAASWTFEHHYQALMDVFAEACRRKQAA